jgi:hypothetical protein
MSSVLVHAGVTTGHPAVTQTATRPRILIVRSCRIAQLLTAVVMARTRNRDAEIVVLSHRGHKHLLRAAGADRVIEVPGRRFGLLRIAPWTLKRLRIENFTEVVIPQMNAHADSHVNLYQMVAALNPARVTIVPGDERPETFDGPRFVQHALRHSCTGVFKSVVIRMVLGAFLK